MLPHIRMSTCVGITYVPDAYDCTLENTHYWVLYVGVFPLHLVGQVCQLIFSLSFFLFSFFFFTSGSVCIFVTLLGRCGLCGQRVPWPSCVYPWPPLSWNEIRLKHTKDLACFSPYIPKQAPLALRQNFHGLLLKLATAANYGCLRGPRLCVVIDQ